MKERNKYSEVKGNPGELLAFEKDERKPHEMGWIARIRMDEHWNVVNDWMNDVGFVPKLMVFTSNGVIGGFKLFADTDCKGQSAFYKIDTAILTTNFDEKLIPSSIGSMQFVKNQPGRD